MKISAKLRKAQEEYPGELTISFEYFVPKTSQGVQNLYDRMDRMYELNPLFVDVTWNAGGVASNMTAEIVHTAESVIGIDTCMHLTCAGMSIEQIDAALEAAHKAGCQSILALRGDPPKLTAEGKVPEGRFKYAIDLVKYIRQKYGDHFDIGVAAYPEGHPEEPDPDVLIGYLKEKVDAGASFVITQMIYDVDLLLDWVHKCRAAGIKVPILPGIMPISGYASFLRRARWCQIRIPPEFLRQLEEVQADDEAVRERGCRLLAEMCIKLIANGVTHLHFYTMNLERSTVMTLERMGMLKLLDERRTSPLPWRQSLGRGREKEDVRPIHWKKRKHSYIIRTSDWDEFPNGRWGNTRSPAFGELERYGLLMRQSAEKARQLWGSPTTKEQLGTLIIKYITGDLSCLPWSDDPVGCEVLPIRERLVQLNSLGYLTTNSQPAVNGVKSTHPIHGWGPPRGYVYQKAYLELLIPEERFMAILPRLEADPMITYYGVQANSSNVYTNASGDEANAVTWGIFPGKEVQQPTIVERASFLAWKDEAFKLTAEWANCYEQGSPTNYLLSDISRSWFLVNIVHNDFQDPDAIFSVFPSEAVPNSHCS